MLKLEDVKSGGELPAKVTTPVVAIAAVFPPVETVRTLTSAVVSRKFRIVPFWNAEYINVQAG